jgi:O-antigen ligase
MEIVVAMLALSGLVWLAVAMQRANLIAVLLAVLIAGYVVGHNFWNTHLGAAPVTLDRLALFAAVALLAVQWRWSALPPMRITPTDWVVAATVLWLTLSAFWNQADAGVLPEPPLGRLLASYWIPTAIYFLARQVAVDSRTVWQLLAALAALGTYLAITALAESAELWSVVFPRYIADPMLGLHFGRARGPALNSVSLGIYLSVCFWATWFLRPKLSRPLQLVAMAIMVLMAIGVFLTYTRSTWIGFVLSGVVVLAIQLPRSWRLPALGSATAAALIALPFAWNHLMGLEREGSASDARHSVSQRAAFTYVSWQMFKDHPLTGVGFGRFYDQKLPYLSDRSQSFELESIRELHHHNTFLGVLTETGLLGLTGFCALLAGWTRTAWRLVRSSDVQSDDRKLGLLCLAVLAIYISSALFHDLSHLPNEQVVLFLIAGLTVAAECGHAVAATSVRRSAQLSHASLGTA